MYLLGEVSHVYTQSGSNTRQPLSAVTSTLEPSAPYTLAGRLFPSHSFRWLTPSRILVTAPQTTSQPTTATTLHRTTSSLHTTTLLINMQSRTRGHPAIRPSKFKLPPSMTLNPEAHPILSTPNPRLPVACPTMRQKTLPVPLRAIHQGPDMKSWTITENGGST